jgi:hypothetical protein
MPKTPVSRIDFLLKLEQDSNRIIPALGKYAMPIRFGDTKAFVGDLKN